MRPACYYAAQSDRDLDAQFRRCWAEPAWVLGSRAEPKATKTADDDSRRAHDDAEARRADAEALFAARPR